MEVRVGKKKNKIFGKLEVGLKREAIFFGCNLILYCFTI